MERKAHSCPMFTPVGSEKENGGTSCGNCAFFNGKHIVNTGREICEKYDEVVFFTRTLSNR
jgi:hypothetical protein